MQGEYVRGDGGHGLPSVLLGWLSRDLCSTAACCVPLDAGCEVTSDWPAVWRQILGGLESHYNPACPQQDEEFGEDKVAGTREMGNLVEGRGVWPTEMKDFEEER